MDYLGINVNSGNGTNLDKRIINNSELPIPNGSGSPAIPSSGSSTPKIHRTSALNKIPIVNFSSASSGNNVPKSENLSAMKRIELECVMDKSKPFEFLGKQSETIIIPRTFSDKSYSYIKNNNPHIVFYKNVSLIDKKNLLSYHPEKNPKDLQSSNFYTSNSKFYPLPTLALYQDFQVVVNEDSRLNEDYFKGYLVFSKNEKEKIYSKALAVFSQVTNTYNFLIDKSSFFKKKFNIQILAMDEQKIVIYRSGFIEIINKICWDSIYSIPLPESCTVQCCLKRNICLLNFGKGKIVAQIDIEKKHILSAKTFLYKIVTDSKSIHFEVYDLKITSHTKLDGLLKQSKELHQTGFIPASINIQMLDNQTLIGDAHYLKKNLFVEIKTEYEIKMQDITKEGFFIIRNKRYKYIEENPERKFLIEEDDFEGKKIPIYCKYHAFYNGTKQREFSLSEINKKGKIKIDNIDYSIDSNLEYIISSNSLIFPLEKKYFVILKNRYEIDSKKFEKDEIIIEEKKYIRETERREGLFIKKEGSQELLSVKNEPEKIFPLVFLLEKGIVKKQINDVFLTEPFHASKDHIGLISYSKIGALNYRTKEEIYFDTPINFNYNCLYINNFIVYWFIKDSKQFCHIFDIEKKEKREFFFKERILKILPAENSKQIVICWATTMESEKSPKKSSSKEDKKPINIFKERNYYLINLKTGKVFEIDKEKFKIPGLQIPEDGITNITEKTKDIIYKHEAVFCYPPYIIQVGETFGRIIPIYQQFRDLFIRSFKYNHELVEGI